jgi:regulator of protease activity HflC (stomatin/prohibitin superfamily)
MSRGRREAWEEKLMLLDVAVNTVSRNSKAPEVTRRRIYLETMQEIMPGIRSTIIVDEEARSILPLLNLDSPKEDRP